MISNRTNEILRKVSSRDTWAEVSLGAIRHNASLFKSSLKDACRFMAVVKANGYGHGSIAVAKAAISAGADYLGVALVDEAIRLRDAGIDVPILVLGYTAPYAVMKAIQHQVSLTVFSEQVLDEIIVCTEEIKQPARIHLKIDSGMTRIGVTSHEEALSLARKAVSSRFVKLEGLFTHFADADSIDPSYTQRQFQRFQAFIRRLEDHGIRIPLKHACNSAAAMQYPDMHLDMVRVGIALYGLYPSSEVRHPGYPLKPAMQLKTRISSLKRVPAGQSVGYGRTFIPQNECLIATVPIGYADGLSRQLSNRGAALVRNRRIPIVGKVCMDQTMLNATSVPSAQIGDEVILFGGSAEAFLSIDEVAEAMNTINYEVVCLIGERVPRIYVD